VIVPALHEGCIQVGDGRPFDLGVDVMIRLLGTVAAIIEPVLVDIDAPQKATAPPLPLTTSSFWWCEPKV